MWYKKGESLLAAMETAQPGEQQVIAWYLGQTGYAVKSRGAMLYIDPMLNDLTGKDGSTRRFYAEPFGGDKLRGDYVLCTHGHLDHLALPTLTAAAAASPSLRFIVPQGCVTMLTEAGIAAERVTGMLPGEKTELPGLTVEAVSAAHPVHVDDPTDRDMALCYLMETDGVRLLHLGDTYLTDRLLADLTAMPAPDILFTPINGGDYFRTARNCIGNLNFREAAELSRLVQADLTIPTHFDMIMGNTVDPTEFLRWFRQVRPGARCHVPVLGEGIRYVKGE